MQLPISVQWAPLTPVQAEQSILPFAGPPNFLTLALGTSSAIPLTSPPANEQWVETPTPNPRAKPSQSKPKVRSPLSLSLGPFRSTQEGLALPRQGPRD